MHHGTSNVDILLVADEQDAARFEEQIRRIGLEDVVQRVLPAAGFEAALGAAASRNRPALIVVDPRVAGGWDLVRRLKASANRRVPILVICDDKECDEAYDQGANGVLVRSRWSDRTDSAAAAVTNFWVLLARLPSVPGARGE